MKVTVDNKELIQFAIGLSTVPEHLETNIASAFTATATVIIERAKEIKPDLIYAPGYRTGELNRSYVTKFKGRTGKSMEMEIGNKAKYFAAVEEGSSSHNTLYGYFVPQWRTGHGKAMFVEGGVGIPGANANPKPRLYNMSPWEGFYMLKKATEDKSTQKMFERQVDKAVKDTFAQALGG